jgi:hypothetical protein
VNNQSNAKTCLLIIPRHFYSFEKLFTTNLESRGYTVTVSNDEYPSNTFGKLLGKLNIPLILPITDKALSRDFLEGRHYDIALIFKGRGIGKSLIKKISRSANKVVGYNWDSFDFNKAPLKWLQYVTNYYTFDYRDADKYSLPVVELFSSLKLEGQGGELSKDIPLSAIFRNHSSRLAYLDKILSILGEDGARIFVYEQNIFFFLLNFIKNPLLYFKYRKYISFNSLNYDDYIDIIQRSEYTVDYAHPAQSGLTMRSFESLSTHTKIITNNKYIERSKYFSHSNAILFPEDGDPARLKAGIQASVGHLVNPEVRTLDDFMDDLLR